MRSSRRRFLPVFLPFLALFGVSSVTTGQPGIVVDPVYTVPVNLLTLTDIDFLKSTTPKLLFSISMHTVPPGQTVLVTMRVQLNIHLSDGESFANAMQFDTDPFTVPGSLTITNIDLTKGTIRVSGPVYFDPGAKKRLQDLALPSGQVPAGSYDFTAAVTPVGGGQSDSKPFSIVLTNPSSVELLFPFDGDQSVSQLPLFQWLFDGARSKIYIYEQLPGQSTFEEAASGVPINTADVTTTSYQYPSGGVRALEPGKTYVWYIEGHIATAGGTDIILKSPLRSFTVAAGGAASLSSILDELEQALDPKYKPIFDQIRAGGFSLSGSIRVNGVAISTTDLQTLINQLRTNPDAVLSVGLQ